MPFVRCPQCGKETEFKGNEWRPFCSERCKLLDFGAWADGEYGIAAETAEMSDEDLDELQNALDKTKNDNVS
jgi:endogenous inhibitor of DNA gyrase (YacG/DUF329 family)